MLNNIERGKNMESKNNKSKILIAVLSVGIVVCIAVTVWAVFFRTNGDADYAANKIEPNAQLIEDDNSEKLEAPVGGGAISLQYEDQVTIDLAAKKAYLNYSNPNKSTQNVMLEIVIQDQTVAQSALIEPGYKVTELPLVSGAESILSDGVYNQNAVFRISSYDPDSGEKAMVATQAEITVTVQN